MADCGYHCLRLITQFGLACFCLMMILIGEGQLCGQAPAGIPRDLARLRAQQLKDVRYQLSFTITPKADSISGHEELRFVQNADDRGILPEWLDFREGSISNLTINGQTGVDGNTKWSRRAARQAAQAG